MALTIETKTTARGLRITISGVIDENADFAALEGLEGRLEICLRDVRRVNSYGARSWMEAIRKLALRSQLVFLECSPPVIDQLNMIQGFLGHGVVESFYGPMICSKCETETLHLFDARVVRDRDGQLPPVLCDTCGMRMGLDDLEEQFTLFLREPTIVR